MPLNILSQVKLGEKYIDKLNTSIEYTIPHNQSANYINTNQLPGVGKYQPVSKNRQVIQVLGSTSLHKQNSHSSSDVLARGSDPQPMKFVGVEVRQHWVLGSTSP